MILTVVEVVPRIKSVSDVWLADKFSFQFAFHMLIT